MCFSLGANLSLAATLDAVQRAGVLACGVVTEQIDFTKDDTHGDLSAFESDMCRAVAAAVLGDAARVHIDGFPDEAYGYQALHRGEIDLLVGASPKPGLPQRYQVAYGQPMFFDGQSFMVDEHTDIAALGDLSGKAVCFIAGTGAEAGLREMSAARGIAIKPFPFEEIGEMEAALVGGRCDAETQDASALAAGRTGFHGRTLEFRLLPEAITLDPLAPAMRANDTEWQQVVDWTLFAMVKAEIDGVTRSTVTPARPSTVADTLGGGSGLGLPIGWSTRVIAAVGNYGEVFERDLGDRSALRLSRGRNRPWTQGGLLWTPF